MSKALYMLLTGGACMGYYFIIAITQLYILTPVLQYLNRKLGVHGVTIILVLNMAGLLALYLSRLFNVISHLPPPCFFIPGLFIMSLACLPGKTKWLFLPEKHVLFRPFVLYALLVSLLISMMETTASYCRNLTIALLRFFPRRTLLFYIPSV